ncbi:LOW QUALITY PROTEIN: AAA+ ATPase domain containing protein [Trema orientale]|uniref:AAA+ ATPase domain containing protein n=1 Tax=Trema orientale TaxID=63057 RepID=A0A2P5ENT5_TREOI|nr:LOW QUALITY PROTEIN: AAA+ ATPase domain containing protein [Trema orientale]
MGNCFSISLQSSSVDSVASCCYEFTAGRAKYVCNLEENLEALQNNLQDVTARKNDVVRRVKVAEEQQQLKRLEEVQRWISTVEAMETEASELLLRRSEEVNKLCLWSCCSKNYKSSYDFGKVVSERLAEVTDLRSKGDFRVVAETEPTAQVVQIPIEPTVGLESLFEKVWRDLGNENVRIMGLYGMGGVGKTTLLKSINNNFLNDPTNSYYVIWVVVSKDQTLEKIQNDIGEKVGCTGDKWRNKNSQQRAEDILKVLSKKKFVLLLDDIWERIDLSEVGVPWPNRKNGSKLVFTTRSMEVCSEMEADKKVEVMCLSRDKSWELFREKVGEQALNRHPDIPDLAKTVAKECAGLPLALITIGRTMACKTTPQEWRHAIRVLNTSASKFSGMVDKVLPRLKFSYDNLSSEKFKSCFLYCALFPEDLEIEKDELINYWMCEGYLDEYVDINDLQDQGYNIIGSLLYACLLEEGSEGSNSVKMHDVIRDMALWIACGCEEAGNRFLVKTNALLVEPPMIEKWNEAEKISCMKNSITSLSETPKCPNLSTLFLQCNELCQISNSFFQYMPKLTVLDLSWNAELRYLPKEISKLISLEYLNLSHTGIEQLPEELKNLVMLKYLNLEYLRRLDKIPQQVISSFSRLQVLNMYWCGMLFAEIEQDIVQCGGNVLLVQELQCLKNIITLDVSIKGVTALENFLTSKMLLKSTRSLYLRQLSTLHFLNLSSFLNMERLDRLDIFDCKSLEELKIDWDWERRDQYSQGKSPPLQCSMLEIKELFQGLREFSIVFCFNVMDLTALIFAPKLRFLLINECKAVEDIIRVEKLGDAPEMVKCLQPFPELESLTLMELPKLKNIYPKPLPFPCLKSIHVLQCKELKKLPICSEITRRGANKLTIMGEQSWWDELEWEDETTRDALLPCFQRRCSLKEQILEHRVRCRPNCTKLCIADFSFLFHSFFFWLSGLKARDMEERNDKNKATKSTTTHNH